LNRDGKITTEELKKVLGTMEAYKNVPENYWVQMVAEFDTDNDGQIDFDEFVQVMTKHDNSVKTK